MTIGFIGAGNMATAIARGLAANGFQTGSLCVYDIDAQKMATLFEQTGARPCESAQDVIASADAVILAVKPQVFPSLLPTLATAFHRHEPLVISIAAGKTIADIEKMLGAGLPIVRVMPNINAKVGEALSAYCGNAQVTDEQYAIVVSVLQAIGEGIAIEEKFFPLFSAMAGCSPAFHLLYIDAIARAGVRYGLPKDTSLKIAAQAVLGTVRLLQETGEHPAALIDQVCSPGGTTIEGVCALKDNGFETAVMQAIKASLEKDLSL